MKKPFLIGVMAILCGLLYVTSLALRQQTDPPAPPKPTAPPTASGGVPEPQPNRKPIADSGSTDSRVRAEHEKAYRQKMMANTKDHPIKQSTQMDLTPDWDRHRTDGEKGIEKVISEREKLKAAEDLAAIETAKAKALMPAKKPEEKTAFPSSK